MDVLCDWCVRDSHRTWHWCLWREVESGAEARDEHPDLGDEPCRCAGNHYH